MGMGSEYTLGNVAIGIFILLLLAAVVLALVALSQTRYVRHKYHVQAHRMRDLDTVMSNTKVNVTVRLYYNRSDVADTDQATFDEVLALVQGVLNPTGADVPNPVNWHVVAAAIGKGVQDEYDTAGTRVKNRDVSGVVVQLFVQPTDVAAEATSTVVYQDGCGEAFGHTVAFEDHGVAA